MDTPPVPPVVKHWLETVLSVTPNWFKALVTWLVGLLIGWYGATEAQMGNLRERVVVVETRMEAIVDTLREIRDRLPEKRKGE